jgi:hypothetical protein
MAKGSKSVRMAMRRFTRLKTPSPNSKVGEFRFMEKTEIDVSLRTTILEAASIA